MKKIMTVFIALTVVVAGGVAWGADTNTLTVTASVSPTCRFVSATSALNFGVLDPGAPVNVNTSAVANFWCTTGVIETIAAGNGANWSGATRQMVGPAPADLIPYSLSLSPDGNSNVGPGTPRVLTISGGVLGANYAGSTPGNYSDTVSITINP